MADIWIRVQMTFPAERLATAKERVDELLRLVVEKDDPAVTLHFEYFFNEETRTFVVIEHFNEPQGVLDHSSHIYDVGMSVYEYCEASQVELYGDVPDEISAFFPGAPVYGLYRSVAATRV
jgi:hypothetical protein